MDLWPLGPWGGRAGEEVSFTRGHSQVTCPAPPSSLLAGLPLREAASKGGHAGEAAGTRTHAGLAGSEGWVATSIGQGPSRRLHIRTLYCSHTQGPSKAATSPEERATTATRKYLASSLGSAGRREEPSTVDGRCSSDRGGGGQLFLTPSPLPPPLCLSLPPSSLGAVVTRVVSKFTALQYKQMRYTHSSTQKLRERTWWRSSCKQNGERRLERCPMGGAPQGVPIPSSPQECPYPSTRKEHPPT